MKKNTIVNFHSGFIMSKIIFVFSFLSFFFFHFHPDTKSVFFGSQLTSESIASIFRLIEYLKRPESKSNPHKYFIFPI